MKTITREKRWPRANLIIYSTVDLLKFEPTVNVKRLSLLTKVKTARSSRQTLKDAASTVSMTKKRIVL